MLVAGVLGDCLMRPACVEDHDVQSTPRICHLIKGIAGGETELQAQLQALAQLCRAACRVRQGAAES